MLARSSVARCVAAVAKTSRHAMAVSVKKATMPAVVARMQSQNAQVRLCSSSRFLSLADEEDGEKKRRRGGEDGEDDGEDNGEEGLEAAEGEAAAEEGEKDGDLELEDEMYKFCVAETDDLDSEIMELYMSDPLKWTPERLARKYHLSKQRVEATIHFQAEEAGLSPEGFVAKVEDAKTLAVQRQKDGAAKLASAEARGDEQEVKRLQKRDRQQQRDVDEVDDEVLTAEETAAALGLDDERYRNPDFFFLNDEFEGYPPLTRRLGKHKSTDKLYPQEAIEIQRLATNNKIEELKSFAKPTDVKNRWKIAVKDTSKNKLPLLVRTEDRSLRLATKEEVLPRSWVRRPAFFAGLSPSDE